MKWTDLDWMTWKVFWKRTHLPQFLFLTLLMLTTVCCSVHTEFQCLCKYFRSKGALLVLTQSWEIFEINPFLAPVAIGYLDNVQASRVGSIQILLYKFEFLLEYRICCSGCQFCNQISNLPKTKGQLNSEWIYEVIVSPKMPSKYLKDFWLGSLLEGRTEILQNFGWHFERNDRNDDLINSFWI